MQDQFIIAGSGTRKLQSASPQLKHHILGELLHILGQYKEDKGDSLVVMSGMAEGFDKALAVAALQLEIPLHLAIPTKTYGRHYWGKTSLTGEDREFEFDTYVEMATKVTYVMEEIHNVHNSLYLGSKHANFIRNDYMVENGDYFLIYDPSTPGTGNCLASVKRARKGWLLVK